MPLCPRSLSFLAVVLLVVGVAGSALGGPPPRHVSVYVDSVLAGATNLGMDSRLNPMRQRLQGAFSFTSYRLVSHQDSETECGKMVSFTLPGGRILHVQPRAIDGNMIAMEIVLFDGARPMMTTDLKLKNNGTLIVGGQRYEQGMLIISIGASTGAPHRPPPTQLVSPAKAITH